jgi:hypothetical protein
MPMRAYSLPRHVRSGLLILSLLGGAACGGGSVDPPMNHRATAQICPPGTTDPSPGQIYDGGSTGPTAPDGGLLSCASDSDCEACANGRADRCIAGGYCSCDECNADEDCGASGVCSCNGSTTGWAGRSVGNVCLPSNCRVDSDCPGGHLCSPTVSSFCGSFYGIQGYYCHTPADQCRNDSDCPKGAYCAYSTDLAQWICSTGFCAG